jgi:hypothetical protein
MTAKYIKGVNALDNLSIIEQMISEIFDYKLTDGIKNFTRTYVCVYNNIELQNINISNIDNGLKSTLLTRCIEQQNNIAYKLLGENVFDHINVASVVELGDKEMIEYYIKQKCYLLKLDYILKDIVGPYAVNLITKIYNSFTNDKLRMIDTEDEYRNKFRKFISFSP